MPTVFPTMFPTASPIRTRSRVSARNPGVSGYGVSSQAVPTHLYANRLYSRRAVDLRARLLARQPADGRIVVVHARTVDLSRTGAGVTLTRELASGSEVVLCLCLPGSGRGPRRARSWLDGEDNPLCLRAVVIRRRGFRAGLEFVQPTAEQRLLLCQFCYA